MRIHEAIIDLGSNINPEINIKRSIELLSESVRIKKESTLIRTQAIGETSQQDYINGALLVETTYDRETLKHLLTRIESELGRDRTSDKFAPRTIDLDILIWDRQIVHRDYPERAFVRAYVAELIDPNVLTIA